MIRMMSGILDDSVDIMAESSNNDPLSTLSKKYYDMMSKSHSEWIEKQKTLFKGLKYDDADNNMYRILTNKYDEHMNKPYRLCMDMMKKIAKYQLEMDEEDKRRISTVKAFLNNHPGLEYNYVCKASDDIGYEFGFSYIDEDKIKDIYARLIEDILKGRDISKDNIAERIYKDYRKLSKLQEKVEDGLKPIISKKDNIPLGKLVEKFDEISTTRIRLMKENISNFNKSYSAIEKEHKASIKAWHQKMKKIKDSGVDGEVANAAYTRCMMNISTINNITQHLMDTCYIIMKASLRLMKDSDTASNLLSNAMLNHVVNLNLDR
jgi:hypothetical protein